VFGVLFGHDNVSENEDAKVSSTLNQGSAVFGSLRIQDDGSIFSLKESYEEVLLPWLGPTSLLRLKEVIADLTMTHDAVSDVSDD
jgi:hypothetical protein